MNIELIFLSVLWLVVFPLGLEAVSWHVFGRYIRYEDYKKLDHTDIRINQFSRSMICTDYGYISTTVRWIACKYYISYDGGGNNRVLRFSKAHHEIEAMYKKLK